MEVFTGAHQPIFFMLFFPTWNRSYKTRNSQSSITFLGEKVLGVLSRNYEFTRDHPQQLNDQSNVVCHFAWQQKKGGCCGFEGGWGWGFDGRQNKTTYWSNIVNGHLSTLGEGWSREVVCSSNLTAQRSESESLRSARKIIWSTVFVMVAKENVALKCIH